MDPSFFFDFEQQLRMQAMLEQAEKLEASSRGVTGQVLYPCEDYDDLDFGSPCGGHALAYWKLKDWVRWNKAEEARTRLVHARPSISVRDFNKHLVYLDEPAYDAILGKTQITARVHAEIGRQMLAKKSILQDFERVWREKTVAKRTQIVIDALRHATLITCGQEACVRNSCPDLTVASMAKDPEGYLKLLRHMIQSHLNHPNQDGFDEYVDPSGGSDWFYAIHREGTSSVPVHRAIRNLQAAVNGDRQTYLARFVFGVLLNLGHVRRNLYRIPSHDPPRLEINRKVSTGVNSSGPRVPKDKLDTYNVDGAKSQEQVDWELALLDKLEEGKEEECVSCCRIRDEVKELVEARAPMMHCSRCLKVNRRVPYCSTTCQSLDWPRHKKQFYCGKLLSKVVDPPVFPLPSSIPPPTLAYQAQFNSVSSRPAEVVYELAYRYEWRRNGTLMRKSRDFQLELKPGSPQRKNFDELVQTLREGEGGGGGANLDKMQELTETLRRLIREREKDDLAQADRYLVEQLSREFDVDAWDLASRCEIVLPPRPPKKEEVETKKVDSGSTLGEEKKKKNRKNKNKKKKKTKTDPSLSASNAEEEEAEGTQSLPSFPVDAGPIDILEAIRASFNLAELES